MMTRGRQIAVTLLPFVVGIGGVMLVLWFAPTPRFPNVEVHPSAFAASPSPEMHFREPEELVLRAGRVAVVQGKEGQSATCSLNIQYGVAMSATCVIKEAPIKFYYSTSDTQFSIGTQEKTK